MYFYGNDSEVYVLMFRTGMSLVLIMVGETGLLGLMVIVLIWPIYLAYLT
jgi:hypothetical protein